MIITVTGGRDLPLSSRDRDAFLEFARSHGEAVLVRHGGASRVVEGRRQGIDFLVGEACMEAGIPVQKWVAKWMRGGRTWYGAGLARNVEMLKGQRETATLYRGGPWTPDIEPLASGLTDILVAWPGGAGTSRCVEAGQRLGVPVVPIADLGR